MSASDLGRTIEVLRAARGLISTREGWCQNTNARDDAGGAVKWESPSATSFCINGAILRAASLGVGTDWVGARAVDALAAVQVEINDPVVSFNDNASHAEVLALIDHTIERLFVEALGKV